MKRGQIKSDSDSIHGGQRKNALRTNELMIAKLNAYCFDKKVVRFIYSYLQSCKRRTKHLIHEAHGKKIYQQYPKVQYLDCYYSTSTYAICFSFQRIVILLTLIERGCKQMSYTNSGENILVQHRLKIPIVKDYQESIQIII